MSAVLGRVTGLLAAAMIAGLVAACAAPPTAAPRSSSQSAVLNSTPAAAVAPLRVPSLQELTGLRPREILAMLGQPDLKRTEPPAELWQYRAADCVLNLFFYLDTAGYRLFHAETWSRDFAASSTPTRCRDASAPVRAHLVQTRSAL
jgi:hypothetical protein